MTHCSEKILLFIPVYNCASQIIRVLRKIDDEVCQYIKEIIVVDNGSSDTTLNEVFAYIKNHPELKIEILRNSENYSLGGSHKIAFQYALQKDFDFIVVLHGDDQGDIHDLLPLLKNGQHYKHDCMLGARFMTGSKLEGYSKFRTFGNLVFNILFMIFLMRPIYDLGSGLNIYKVKMLHGRWWERFPDGLTFNYCMIMASHYFKHDCKFFPITWREDDQVSNVKLFNQAISVVKMLLKYSILGRSYLLSDLRLKAFTNYNYEVLSEVEAL